MTDHFRDATKMLPDLARLRDLLAEATIDNFPWQCCVGVRETVEVFNALPALLDAAEAWQRHTTQLHTLIGCGGCGCGVQDRYALTINGKPHCQTCAQAWIIRTGDMFSLMIERLNRAEGLEADNAALRAAAEAWATAMGYRVEWEGGE